MRPSFALFLCLIGGLTGFQPGLLFAQAVAPGVRAGSSTAPDSSSLKIVIIAGQNAANAVKNHLAVQPIIEVRDANNQPVAAAVVTLQSPIEGPSVLFANGGRNISVVAGIHGRAAIEEMTPVGLGAFKITVTASSGGAFGNTTILQTNYPSVADAAANGVPATFIAQPSGSESAKHVSKGVLIGAIVGVAAAVAVGVVLGTRGHGSSGTTSTIGAGTPTVGAPQ
ncbi:MAG: hypothetical protein JOY54_08920 [Acidobacteriaceae bacterium]|nr:hypothetical protein [Acidobacteriaceae bacterium]